MPNLVIGGTYEFHGHLLSDPTQPYSLKVKVVGQPRTQVLTPGLEAYLLDLLFDTPIDVEQPTRWPWRANESDHGEFFMTTTQVKQHIEAVTGHKVNLRKLGMSMRTRFKRAVNCSRWGYFIRKRPIPNDQARLAASVGSPRWVLPSTVSGHDEFKLKPQPTPQPTPQPQPTHQADWFDELTQPHPVRRPGRPRKHPNQFLLNLTESERHALEALATKFNCSMTQAVRQALAAYATTSTTATATQPEYSVMRTPQPDLFNQVNTSGL